MTAIPPTMRAAANDRFGPPDVLQIHSAPVPEIGPGEVLVAVHTAGVGSWDLEIRDGWWPYGKPNFPLILGTDGSGTIAAAGSRIRRLRVGEQVYAFSMPNPKGGYYAEYIAVKAEYVAPIPRGLDLTQAGAIPAIGLTALQGVDDALKLKPGERILIHGASGGLGILAVQFAKLRGALVLGTASGPDGVDLVRRLGADMVVDGKHDDIRTAARAFAPQGLDAILTFLGGKELTRALDAVRRGGRLAHPDGVQPAPRKRKGMKLIVYDAAPGVAEFQRLNRAIEAARPELPIVANFPLGQAAQAHERVAQGHVLGKVVLRIS